jgi:hypothetical protein
VRGGPHSQAQTVGLLIASLRRPGGPVKFSKLIKAYAIYSLLLLSCLAGCTGSRPTDILIAKGGGNQGNAGGYTGIIKPSSLMTLALVDDLISNPASTVRNFGAQIADGILRFAGPAFSRYWGGDAYVTVDAVPELNFGDKDFTVETFVRFSQIGLYNRMLTRWDNPQKLWLLTLETGEIEPLKGTPSWIFWWSSDGFTEQYLGCNANPRTGEWYHLAVSREGGQIRFFVDGKLCSERSIKGAIAGSDTQELNLGRMSRHERPQLLGDLAHTRIIHGEALFKQPFPSRKTSSDSAIARPGLMCDGDKVRHCH